MAGYLFDPVPTLRSLPGFQTLLEETAVDRLDIHGRIPAWLEGTLIRNGPAQFEVGTQPVGHWFDGLAMLHRFAFSGGQVAYANRFLRSLTYLRARTKGRFSGWGFDTPPAATLAGRLFSYVTGDLSDNANGNITAIGGRYLALGDSPIPVEFDPETLKTYGRFRFADAPSLSALKALTEPDPLAGQISTAHPQFDPATKERYNFVTEFGLSPQYRIYRIRPGADARERIAAIPVHMPGYIHSFALTRRYVVLAEYPLLARPADLLLSGRPFIQNFKWMERRATRFLVLERSFHNLTGIYEAPPCFALHHVNAYEEKDVLLLDIAAYDSPAEIDDLRLDRPLTKRPSRVELRRYRIPLRSGAVTHDVLADPGLEFPTIHYQRCNTRPYRYAYGVTTVGEAPFMNALMKVDVTGGDRKVWTDEFVFPGEGLFVPRPGGEAEDDGVVLSVVLDGRQERSFLLVLDAATFQEIARADLPFAIPFGFHGQFLGRE